MYHDVTRTDHTQVDGAPAQVDGAPDEATQRKERVLHTRIPAVLERDLKRLAGQLRLPVSNLVRAILEDALTVADKASGVVQAELTNAANAVSHQRETIQRRLRDLDLEDEVLGFQPMLLAQPTACTRCGVALDRGVQGWLGLRASPGPAIVVCAGCVPGPAR
jgi:hypothetical protein